jgi:hypothetical protein
MQPSPETSKARTPDEQVAHIIGHELSAGEVIAASQVQKVVSGLASGTLRAADWRRIAEIALDLEARDGKVTP